MAPHEILPTRRIDPIAPKVPVSMERRGRVRVVSTATATRIHPRASILGLGVRVRGEGAKVY